MYIPNDARSKSDDSEDVKESNKCSGGDIHDHDEDCDQDNVEDFDHTRIHSRKATSAVEVISMIMMRIVIRTMLKILITLEYIG